MRELTVEELAQELHEAGREAVANGDVLNRPRNPQPFVEWTDLPRPAKMGRRKQASYILARYQVTARE